MVLEGILGRLHALLGLEPDKTELILDIVDHDFTTFLTTLLSLLSRRVGTLERKVLVGLLQVLAAVALPQNTVDLLDLEGVRENFISGNDVLNAPQTSMSAMFFSSTCFVSVIEVQPLKWGDVHLNWA